MIIYWLFELLSFRNLFSLIAIISLAYSLYLGPYKVNGVPVRRVNQAYVIATKTSIDISAVKVDAKFNDEYFRKEQKDKKKKTEEQFFAEEKDKVIFITRCLI